MPMLHDLKLLFHVLIIFQCLFFAFLLLSQEKGRKGSNLLLAGFLLARASSELGGFFFHFQALREVLYARAPRLFWIDLPFDFLYVPLLFLYVLSLTRKDFRLKPVHALNAIPAALALAYILVRFEFRNPDVLRAAISADARFGETEGNVISFLSYVQLFAYSAAGLAVLQSFRRRIKDVFSSVERINLSWLKLVLWGFVAWQAVSFSEYALWLLIGYRTIIYVLYILSEVTFLVFLCVLFVRGLRQPEVFTEETSLPPRKKYEKAQIPDALRDAYRVKLVQVMETDKPYLDPLLSLPALARRVGVPAHQLSQVINACFGQNFFDFVNGHRIREGQRLLAESAAAERTILDVIYEVGFNSKSVFNTAFKKHTGMTPSEYRRQIHAS